MFKFLKKKLGEAISKFSKKVEEEGTEEVVEVEKPKKEVKKPAPKKEEPKPVKKEKFVPKKEKPKEEVEEKPKEEKRIQDKLKKLKPEKKVKKVFVEEKEKVVEEKEEEKLIEEPEEKEEPEVIEEKEEPEEEKIEEPKEKVVQEIIEEKIEEPKEEKPKKGFLSRLFKKKEKVEEEIVEEEPEVVKEKEYTVQEPEVIEEKEEEKVIEEKEPEEEAPKGFFQKIKQKVTTKKISEKQFNDMFWELELAMLENNVAVEVIEKIKQDLQEQLVDRPIPRGKIEEKIIKSLKDSIQELFVDTDKDFITTLQSKKPYVICFIGINGSGKTTSIAKVAHMLQEKGLSVVLAAADTFRAAAIDQLQTHADKLGVKLIKHDYGSDAAAVAFDAVKHAEAKKVDVVLIDTAGRLHSNVNLMDEMKKLIRVANPDMKLFVGESITGNDCVEQAQKFNEAVGIDGIILSKADVDEKGGAAISVSYVTGKPIFFLGMGQEYGDLEAFDSKKIMANLGL